MVVIIGSKDKHLSTSIGQLAADAGHRCIRTDRIERILKELKTKDRCVVIDVNWDLAQQPGVLKQMVNIGRITDNKVVCVCPNTEEELKALARSARPAEIFIRYDLHLSFNDFIKGL